jgi:hypothetical protein
MGKWQDLYYYIYIFWRWGAHWVSSIRRGVRASIKIPLLSTQHDVYMTHLVPWLH